MESFEEKKQQGETSKHLTPKTFQNLAISRLAPASCASRWGIRARGAFAKIFFAQQKRTQLS